MEMDSDSSGEYYVDRLDDFQGETLVELDSSRVEETVTKKRKKTVVNFEISGVIKVTLNELTQGSLGLVVGSDVTWEYPWKKVNKELLYDNISVLQDDSAFSYYKPELDNYDEEELLFGYIHDDLKLEDDFYLCITKEAKDQCEVQVEKIVKNQIKKLDKYIYKTPGEWTSLGSEKYVEESHVVRSRPLIQIKYISKQKKLNNVPKLSPKNSEPVSLLPNREKFNVIVKRRTDTAIEAVPERISSEAQTTPKFPQNTWTQSSLESHEIYITTQNSNEELMLQVKAFLDRHIDYIENIVKFNATIDIYNMDYPSLAKESGTSRIITELEYNDCLINEHVEDKVISCADWHYFWEGIIVVSYAENIKYLHTPSPAEKDEVDAIIHDQNITLIWSISDKLRPKLYLECDREVKTVSFCPFDENIVVGGCVNGQVIIWNIEGRLQEVEEGSVDEESEAWLEYELGWSRKFHDRAVLRPVAIANIASCHFLEVTAISWISPNMEFNKTGRIALVPDGAKRSTQFLTISLDGNIMVWNCDEIKSPSSGFQALKQEFDNIKSNYPELNLYELPDQQIDRNWKPIYKMIVGDSETTRVKPLTCIFFQTLDIKYELQPQANKSRKSYTCQVQDSNENDIPSIIWLGTLYGDVLKIAWSGQPQDSEPINEYCCYKLNCLIHNGPILALVRNPFFKNIYVTIGGKIMAVWSELLDKEPLFWKSLTRNLTDVKWSPYIPSQLFVCTENGSFEVWDFCHKSHASFKIENISESPLTGMFIHRLPMEKNIVAIGDYLGALRLYTLPNFYNICDDKRIDESKLFFDRELQTKEYFYRFKEKWLSDHAEKLESARKLKAERLKELEKKQRLAKIKEQEHKDAAQEAKNNEKVKSSKQECEERWRSLQWEYAESVIQEKKMMNKSKLLKEEKPLQDLLTHINERAIKVEDYSKKNRRIFEESVGIFFPEARLQKHDTLKITPLEEIISKKAQYMREYEIICKEATEFLKNNPVDIKFDWHKLMNEKDETKTKHTQDVVEEEEVLKTEF